MNRTTRLLTLTTALLLAGCGSVPLGSLPKLSRIDAETTDLSALRVALRVPDAIGPRPRGVNMDVALRMTGEPEQKTTFLLTETRDQADLTGLPPANQSGYSTYSFRLSPEDVARFEAIRATALSNRHSGKKGSMDIAIATKEFCRIGALPKGPLLASTYLKTSETKTYVTLTRDLDLAREEALADAMNRLEPC